MIIGYSEPFGLRHKDYPDKPVRIYKVMHMSSIAARDEIRSMKRKQKVMSVEVNTKASKKSKGLYWVYAVMD